jgi:hypothetical protein
MSKRLIASVYRRRCHNITTSSLFFNNYRTTTTCSFSTSINHQFPSIQQVPSPLQTTEWLIDLSSNKEGLDSQTVSSIQSLMNRIEKENLPLGGNIKVTVVYGSLSDVSNLSNWAKDLFEHWGLPNHSIIVVVDTTRSEIGLYVMDESVTKQGASLPSLFTESWYLNLKSKQLPPLFESNNHQQVVVTVLESILQKLKTQYSPVSDQYRESRIEFAKSGKGRTTYSRSTAIGRSMKDLALFFGVLGAAGYLIYWYFFSTQTCPSCNSYSLRYKKDITQSNYESYINNNNPELQSIVSKENKKELELNSCHFYHYKCSKCNYEKVTRKVNEFSPYQQCNKCDTKAVSTVKQNLADTDNSSLNIIEVTRECQNCGDRKETWLQDKRK